jgi:two-component system, chemotaxis family, response regulator Rcp1
MSDGLHPEPKIWLVEDNPVDVLMIKRALRNGGFKNQPVVMDDGEPALALLRIQRGPEAESLPDLIILDLNLRRVGGAEVLAYIRQTEELKALRVIVLSSSPEDVMRSSAANADCYIEKPTDVVSFQNLGRRIHTFYWGGRASTAGS